MTTELVNERKVDKKTNAETWTLSKMLREMNSKRDIISHKIDVSKQLDAHCNIPKIHLMLHWVEQIHQYGALHQYSAKRHEQAHKMNLKDDRDTAKHIVNCLLQVITFQRRILGF